MIVNFGRDLWGEGSPGQLIGLALFRFLLCHFLVYCNFAGYQVIPGDVTRSI